MITLKVFKSKNFFFYLPLGVILDKQSIDELEEEKLSFKTFSLNKLDNKTKESETLKLIYDALSRDNYFSLFNDLVAIAFCDIEERN
jgi:hypothetical protein